MVHRLYSAVYKMTDFSLRSFLSDSLYVYLFRFLMLSGLIVTTLWEHFYNRKQCDKITSVAAFLTIATIIIINT